MSKYTDIEIEKDGSKLSKSKKNYIKVKRGVFKLSFGDEELQFEIEDFNDEGAAIHDLKINEKDSSIGFRYSGEWDMAEDSDDEKVENVDFKFKVTFKEAKDFEEIKKYFAKYL